MRFPELCSFSSSFPGLTSATLRAVGAVFFKATNEEDEDDSMDYGMEACLHQVGSLLSVPALTQSEASRHKGNFSNRKTPCPCMFLPLTYSAS